jgi:hypothetical protein
VNLGQEFFFSLLVFIPFTLGLGTIFRVPGPFESDHEPGHGQNQSHKDYLVKRHEMFAQPPGTVALRHAILFHETNS